MKTLILSFFLLVSVNAIAGTWKPISPTLTMKATTQPQIVDLQNKYIIFSSYKPTEIKEIYIESTLFLFVGETKCVSTDPRLIRTWEPSTKINFVDGNSVYFQPIGWLDADPCIHD